MGAICRVEKSVKNGPFLFILIYVGCVEPLGKLKSDVPADFYREVYSFGGVGARPGAPPGLQNSRRIINFRLIAPMKFFNLLK